MNHSTPPILLLPSEIKHLIVTELSSPGSLAALARTHTSFQKYAEQALYHTVAVQIREKVPLTCLETLAANSEKATLVRSLKIERSDHLTVTKTDRRATTCLAKALVNMHFLTDLRIKIHPTAKKSIKDLKFLNNALCQGHFQLKTLYCNDILNIPRIIKSQTELQILGIYTPQDTYHLKTFKHFRDVQLSIPIIFRLNYDIFCPSKYISIYPAFYSVDRITTIHQLLAESLSKDWHVNWGADQCYDLTVFLIDSSDMSTIYALAKGIAGYFPQICRLSFSFERICEIRSHEMKEVLPLFSNLREVEFWVWPGNMDPDYLYTSEDVDAVVAHAKIWGAACPELTEVEFFHIVVKKKEEDGWKHQ